MRSIFTASAAAMAGTTLLAGSAFALEGTLRIMSDMSNPGPRAVMESLRRAFRPECLNRVDATIVFRSLSREEIKEIVDLELSKVNERLVVKGFETLRDRSKVKVLQ